MKNITINIPDCYEKNIQWLIDNNLIASRSQAIRTALKNFLTVEYNVNLELLGYVLSETKSIETFANENGKKPEIPTIKPNEYFRENTTIVPKAVIPAITSITPPRNKSTPTYLRGINE